MATTRQILTARDIMVTSLITLKPDMSVFDAMRILIGKRISGAPVVDAHGTMVGILSELDCLRVLSSDQFYAEQEEESGIVEVFMSGPGRTIPPDLGIYAIAHYFLTTSLRRLPVVENGHLVGQVSRRDVLRGIETMRKRRTPLRGNDYLSVARSWSAL